MMKRYARIGIFLWLLASPAMALDTPTLGLRRQALEAHTQQHDSEARTALESALALARKQADPYVKANELRYIAEVWSRMGQSEQASAVFDEAMETAIRIPTWNHRLYASIGVIEMQRGTGDGEGTRRNGLKALEGGLMEAVAASGGAAEMGRFFTALDGLLTEQERQALRNRISQIGGEQFRRKALHALDKISVRFEADSIR